jgi:hypothetical protein
MAIRVQLRYTPPAEDDDPNPKEVVMNYDLGMERVIDLLNELQDDEVA